MNFHTKALLAFLAFHVIVTGGGLMFDQVPQALRHGANDNDAQLVGGVRLRVTMVSRWTRHTLAVVDKGAGGLGGEFGWPSRF